MTIQDAIKAITEAECQITMVFESFQYISPPYAHIIVCSIYNEDVIEQCPIVSPTIAFFVLNDDGMTDALIDAMSGVSYPMILFFHAINLSIVDDNLIANFISKLRYPITVVFSNMKLSYADMNTAIAAVIREAGCPITLIFENSELSSSSTNRLGMAAKEARVPITLHFVDSYIMSCGSLVKALKEALAPISITFNDPDELDHWLSDSALKDNFVIDARTNPSRFLKCLGVSMVSLMLNKVLFSCPKELVDLIISYISYADLAWTEVLAIRAVEAASYENKYSSINITALMLEYFPEHQVGDKKQDTKSKDFASRNINHELVPHELLIRLVALLEQKRKLHFTGVLQNEFKCREFIDKFLTLVPFCYAPTMTIPAGFRNVPSDGLCFYHAVARQLGTTDGIELQREAINEILVNYARYQDFLEDNFWDDNLESPGKDTRGWAGHVMIQAVANMLHRPIEIRRFGLDGIENQDKMLILPYKLNPDHEELRLGNIANLHFVAANDSILIEQASTEYNSPDNTDTSVASHQTLLKPFGENTESHEDL